MIQGNTFTDDVGVGWSVSNAGDVNGDGYDDLIIGAPDLDRAYVVFGHDGAFGTMVDGRQVLNLAELTPSQGFIIQGSPSEVNLGFSVASAGDVNNDGYADIILGAPHANGKAGEIVLLLGHAGTAFGVVNGDGQQVVTVGALTKSYLADSVAKDSTLAGTAEPDARIANAIDGGPLADVLAAPYTGNDVVDTSHTEYQGGGNNTLELADSVHDTLLYKLLSAAEAAGGNDPDQINGFVAGTHEVAPSTDRINLAELVSGYKPDNPNGPTHHIDDIAAIDAENPIAQYLRVTHSNDNTIVNIDRDSHQAGTYGATTQMTASGVNAELATLLANHQIVAEVA
jgi:hypothetical protein